MGFIIKALFFWGSQFFMRIRIVSIIRVGGDILRRVHVFIAIREVVVFIVLRCVEFIKVTLFVKVLVGIGTIGFAISELKVVFVESAVSADAIFF